MTRVLALLALGGCGWLVWRRLSGPLAELLEALDVTNEDGL